MHQTKEEEGAGFGRARYRRAARLPTKRKVLAVQSRTIAHALFE